MVKDHLGNTYGSVKEMTAFYGIAHDTFKRRRKKGASLEEALTAKFFTSPVYDHLGKRYTTKEEMCKAYGINHTIFGNRIRYGWSVEKALTTPIVPVKHTVSSPTDPFDPTIQYRSVDAMCRHYGIPRATFENRRLAGASVAEALSADYINVKAIPITIDNMTFVSIREFAQHYQMNPSSVSFYLSHGISIEEMVKKHSPLSAQYNAARVMVVNKAEHILFASISIAADYYNLSYDVAQRIVNNTSNDRLSYASQTALDAAKEGLLTIVGDISRSGIKQ